MNFHVDNPDYDSSARNLRSNNQHRLPNDNFHPPRHEMRNQFHNYPANNVNLSNSVYHQPYNDRRVDNQQSYRWFPGPTERANYPRHESYATNYPNNAGYHPNDRMAKSNHLAHNMPNRSNTILDDYNRNQNQHHQQQNQAARQHSNFTNEDHTPQDQNYMFSPQNRYDLLSPYPLKSGLNGKPRDFFKNSNDPRYLQKLDGGKHHSEPVKQHNKSERPASTILPGTTEQYNINNFNHHHMPGFLPYFDSARGDNMESSFNPAGLTSSYRRRSRVQIPAYNFDAYEKHLHEETHVCGYAAYLTEKIKPEDLKLNSNLEQEIGREPTMTVGNLKITNKNSHRSEINPSASRKKSSVKTQKLPHKIEKNNSVVSSELDDSIFNAIEKGDAINVNQLRKEIFLSNLISDMKSNFSYRNEQTRQYSIEYILDIIPCEPIIVRTFYEKRKQSIGPYFLRPIDS